MSNEEIESVLRDIEINREQGIPFSQWGRREQMVDAYYNTGGGCPSSAGRGFNITPEMVRETVVLDTQETEQGKIYSELLREMEAMDG